MNADERRYVYTEKKKKIKLAAPVPFSEATGQAQTFSPRTLAVKKGIGGKNAKIKRDRC